MHFDELHVNYLSDSLTFLNYRFVSMLPKGVVFVVFCFLLRVVMAMGGAAADTASFAIVAGEFGNSIGTVTVRVITDIN